MQTIALVGHGTWFDCGTLLKSYDVVIALDGGYQFCQKLEIAPTITLGDGDSITDKPTNFILSTDQTTTDLQKGLVYIQEHYNNYVIDLFGFVSIDRLDHTLSAIQLLVENNHIRQLYSPYQIIQKIQQSITLSLLTEFSLVPMTPSACVTIAGATWSGTFTLDSTHSGLSNQVTNNQTTITVQQGTVLCITPTLWTKP